jgi:hypothetical protein
MGVQGRTWLPKLPDYNILENVRHNHQHAKHCEMSFHVLVMYVQQWTKNGERGTSRAITDKWYEIWYGYRYGNTYFVISYSLLGGGGKSSKIKHQSTWLTLDVTLAQVNVRMRNQNWRLYGCKYLWRVMCFMRPCTGKIAVFRDSSSYGLVHKYQRFGWNYCYHL